MISVEKIHDLLVEFHDFSTTTVIFHDLQAWKIPFLNSMTFQDACMGTLSI